MDEFYYIPKVSMGDMEKCLNMESFLKFSDMIDADNTLTPDKKNFLKVLSTRFIIFKYEKLADFYATTDPVMQEWLEKLKCVIVDNDSAMKMDILSIGMIILT